MRKLLLLVALVGGAILYRRRRGGARRELVRLHYADGSMVTLEPGAPGAERLVTLARRAL